MKLLSRLKEETMHAVPAIIFFAISFNLTNLTERLMLKPHDIDAPYISYFAATIAALIVGKIIIIANTLPFINAFPKKPLIYNIIWKFLVYGLLTILFRIADRFLHLLYKYKTLSVTLEHLSKALHSSLFWAIILWLLMLFAIYISNSEFINAIGKRKTTKMIFG